MGGRPVDRPVDVDGRVEVSLPKILGSMVMYFAVTLGMNKFLFPRVVEWLDKRAAKAAVKNTATPLRRQR